MPDTVAPRKAMPSLQRIVEYWWSADETFTLFPHHEAQKIGWGEPHCFRCGWLAPPADADGDWSRSAGWLERCHLQDHAHGGSDVDPSNIVPLCVSCHRRMPICKTRQDGIAYVNTPENAHFTTWVQMMTDWVAGQREAPGRKAERYWELRALACEAMLAANGLPCSSHVQNLATRVETPPEVATST